MEKITRQAMTELLAMRGEGPAVTLYIPMIKSATPPQMTENQIRFKNLLHKAKDLVEQQSEANHTFIVELKDLLESTMHDQHFWEKQSEGLLICARQGTIRLFRLPVDTEEYVAVDATFHLTPVLGLLHDARSFYVLAIAQKEPRLYQGSMYGLEEAPIKLPESIAVGLHIDENNQKSEQSLSAGGSSMNTNAFNGRGGARDPREEDRARFMRMIDRLLIDKGDRTMPLVLAGTDSEVTEYRGLSKYPKILEGSINKGTHDMPLDDLFEEARHIVQHELIMPQHQRAIEEYKRIQATAHERTADTPSTIGAAAEQGRVGTLLLGMSRLTTDTVGSNYDAVARITFPEDSLKDALNRVAMAVHNTSGEVIIVDESEMPGSRQMAAVLRY